MSIGKDGKKLVSSVITRYMYQVVYLLTLFFLTPYMIHKLGDYYYGLWIIVSIMVNYMSYTELGVTSAIQRYLSMAFGEGNIKECNEIYNNGFLLNYFTCIIILVISALSAFLTIVFMIKDYYLVANLIAIMGASLAISFLFKTHYAVLTSNIRFDIISGVNVIQLVLNTVLTFILLEQGFGLTGLAVNNLVTTIISNFLYVIFSKKLYDSVFLDFGLISKACIIKLFSYSAKSFSIQLADVLRSKMDEIVIATLISLTMVTPYSVAQKLKSAAVNFCYMFTNILNPYIAKQENIKSREEKINTYYLMSKIMIVMISLIFFGFCYLGKPFIDIWVGSKYEVAYYVLIIIMFNYYISLVQSVGIQYMYSTDKHEYLAFINITDGILNIILSIVFVVYFKLGIIGVALGSLAPAFFTKLILQPIYICKVINITLYEYYIFYIKTNLTGILLYFIIGLVSLKFKPDNYLEIMAYIVAFFTFAGIHFYTILDNKERNRFITLLKPNFAFK